MLSHHRVFFCDPAKWFSKSFARHASIMFGAVAGCEPRRCSHFLGIHVNILAMFKRCIKVSKNNRWAPVPCYATLCQHVPNQVHKTSHNMFFDTIVGRLRSGARGVRTHVQPYDQQLLVHTSMSGINLALPCNTLVLKHVTPQTRFWLQTSCV